MEGRGKPSGGRPRGRACGTTTTLSPVLLNRGTPAPCLLLPPGRVVMESDASGSADTGWRQATPSPPTLPRVVGERDGALPLLGLRLERWRSGFSTPCAIPFSASLPDYCAAALLCLSRVSRSVLFRKAVSSPTSDE
ncbi:hypothetical protein MRX96_002434 [Rhipicephalus microplus]